MQPVKPATVFGQWQTFKFREKGQLVCYMALSYRPKNLTYVKRGTAHLIITHRPGDSSKDVISFASGFVFKPESTVLIHVGKTTFDLFTTRDTAWTRDTISDHRLAAAIRNNSSLTIKSTPIVKEKNVHPITDQIQLFGAAAAYGKISRDCGYEVTQPPNRAKHKNLKQKHGKR
jgi:hypothetical protein